MTEAELSRQVADAQARNRLLEEELAETSKGFLALTMELENRVDERTSELRAAQEELAQTNRDLIQLATELEDRVAQRTAELRARDEEMRAMTEQLWQTAKLATVGELAASIAHELNNPLEIVTLRVESLLAQVPHDDVRGRALSIIEQEVERMARLVSNLLEFSRRSALHISTVEVREEISKTLELVHYHLRNRSIEVVKRFEDDAPMIHADRQQLRQLFLNLFTNASDAMPEGGTLTIRICRTGLPLPAREGSATGVLVEVADTGAGISQEYLAKVVEPFFTTKPAGKGTGLGLPICRRIVEEHHGTFEIASELGKGTTVRVALPAANGANGHHLMSGQGITAAS